MRRLTDAERIIFQGISVKECLGWIEAQYIAVEKYLGIKEATEQIEIAYAFDFVNGTPCVLTKSKYYNLGALVQ